MIRALQKTNVTILKRHPVHPPVTHRRVRLARTCSANSVLLFNVWVHVSCELEVGSLQTTLSAVVQGAGEVEKEPDGASRIKRVRGGMSRDKRG